MTISWRAALRLQPILETASTKLPASKGCIPRLSAPRYYESPAASRTFSQIIAIMHRLPDGQLGYWPVRLAPMPIRNAVIMVISG